MVRTTHCGCEPIINDSYSFSIFSWQGHLAFRTLEVGTVSSPPKPANPWMLSILGLSDSSCDYTDAYSPRKIIPTVNVDHFQRNPSLLELDFKFSIEFRIENQIELL